MSKNLDLYAASNTVTTAGMLICIHARKLYIGLNTVNTLMSLSPNQEFEPIITSH